MAPVPAGPTDRQVVGAALSRRRQLRRPSATATTPTARTRRCGCGQCLDYLPSYLPACATAVHAHRSHPPPCVCRMAQASPTSPTSPGTAASGGYISGGTGDDDADWQAGAAPWSPWLGAAAALMKQQGDQLKLVDWLSRDGEDDDNPFASTYEIRALVKVAARRICKGV
jgi:hypothetical protein